MMSIYTITLKRELLNEEQLGGELGEEAARHQQQQQRREQGQQQEEGQEAEPDRRVQSTDNVSERVASARGQQLKQQSEQQALLQATKGRELIHSVNVTLEVTADLRQPSRIVWFKNGTQLTSSERPIFYAQASKVNDNNNNNNNTSNNKTASDSSSGGLIDNSSSGGGGKRSVKRTSQSKITTNLRANNQNIPIEETTTTTEIEEQLISDENGHNNKQSAAGVVAVEKCRQESNDKGSKLTIFDLQDEDYGQYTCKLIDLHGNQLDIHTQLKQDSSSVADKQARSEEEDEKTANSKLKQHQLALAKLIGMDEIIEVKEGDLNIELGIQILPETNDDEELMSEEEKAEFIENTTISWFKDDVKLDQNDVEVLKLFQFTYDQIEGFHRLIVRKATKETEGVYTCLVENESGTSSCSTQLVVGPGNKPKLTSRLQDVTVYVGQSLEFRIKSTGLPPIDSCQWFKDDELLIELASVAPSDQSVKSRTNERVSMSRSEEWSSARRADEDKVLIFRLCIDSLKLDDTGRYKCRINNEYGYDESDCFVKVLQEIIEEHEEIEETIEETLRLGGGSKRSTQAAEEEQEEELVTTSEEQREIKRQRSEGGRAPQFRRRLEDVTVIEETTTTTTTVTQETLTVSTVKDEWSQSADKLKIRWLVDGREIASSSGDSVVDSSDDSISYRVENFHNQTSDEWEHRLVISKQKQRRSQQQQQRRQSSAGASASRRSVECVASNEFGETKTSNTVRWVRRPRFLRQLEDTETSAGETVVMKVTVEEEEEQEEETTTTTSSINSAGDDVRFLHDGKLVYSSKKDGKQRDITTANKSKIRIRSYEEIVEEEVEEEEEEVTTTRRTSRVTTTTTSRRQSATGGRPKATRKTRGKTYEITIDNVQVDQQGAWECQAQNAAGEVSCRADLEVYAEPKIVTDLPQNVRIQPGKEIRLTVEASGSPIPVYSWFKDGLGIAEVENRVYTETSKSRTSTSSTTTRRRSSLTSLRSEDGVSISGETLIIRQAKPEDAGVYQCKVENRLGQVESRECTLTVIGHGDDMRAAPRIIKDLSRDSLYEIDEGETVLLKVLAEGQPKPSQHWFKDTEEIIERETRYEVEQVGQEYTLTIRRSQAKDSGSYKVVLRNEMGETESKTVVVRVNELTSERQPEAPSILVGSQDKVVGLGSNVSFDVEVGGHPKPIITWYKNGRRMTETSDGRVSFVEEETTTTVTVTETEEGEVGGGHKVGERKEITTTHKLVIRDVRETDEAIYSLKAENDLGCAKSSLISLNVDKRKEATDELAAEEEEARTRKEQKQEVEEIVEETSTTTTTVTKSKEEREDMLDESERRKTKSKSRQVEEMEVDEDEDGELDEEGKKRKQIRTTRTTTKKTTTTRTEEEEMEDEDEETRRRRKIKEQQDEEESKKSKSKRRVVDEVEEEVEEEEEERVKRRVRVDEESERVDEEEEQTKRKVVQMDVDEEEQIDEEEEELEKKRRRSKRRDSREAKSESSRRGSEQVIEEDEEEEEETVEDKKKRKTRTTTTTVEKKRSAQGPRIVSAPKEVVAGLGSSPDLEVEFEEITTETREETTTTKTTWLKDGQPIADRLKRDNHIEFIEKSGSQPDTKKRVLRINSLRSSDEGEYVLKVENEHGSAETEPIKVSIDRSMRAGQRPSIVPADIAPAGEPKAPEIVSVPEEIVAGIGSSPQIVAEIQAEPKPQLTWFKDGQPISDAELKRGHLEVVDLPTDEPGVVKQALKINDLKPADVAAYHVKAENPLGEAESEPTNVRIDRSMGPEDEPLVSGVPSEPMISDEAEPVKQAEKAEAAPTIVSAPEEIIAGAGSHPQIEAEVAGSPAPQLTWLKDGKPVSDRDLRMGHVEIIDLPTDNPDTVKQALKINDLRPTDVADYQVKAENPLGSVESKPTSVKLDRSMGPREEPVVKGLDPSQADEAQALTGGKRRSVPADDGTFAPEIVSVPEEVAAGRGGSPQIEAEVTGKPLPEISWLKDGQPVSDRDLRTGHVEIIDLPTDKPDTVKQALKINDLRPTDVADYQVKAKNPLGSVESQPVGVKLDRSMSSTEEPVVKGLDKPSSQQAAELAGAGALPDDAFAPLIVSAPEEVVAGRGGSPLLEAEVAGKPQPEITWLKDGKPISEQDIKSGHVEVVDLPTDKPDTVKQALKINSLKPADVAEYQVKAENPLGSAESQPIGVKLDRSMSSTDEPVVKGLERDPSQQAGDLATREALPDDAFAPSIVSAPEEVVAGRGSSPLVEAEVTGKPLPEISWFKDGQPISEQDLKSGHVEIVDVPTSKPDTLKQALKINDLKPADVAAYHVKAENPLGEVESEPTNVRIDRSMAPEDKPKVSGIEQPEGETAADLERPSGAQSAPTIISAPEEIIAGAGSHPQIEAEVAGSPAPQLTWLKDGKPVSDRDLRMGHVEIIDLPTDKPDTVKQALKINDFRPTDVADYQVKAENPLGSVESKPTSVKLDRSMGPREEPVVKGLDPSQADEAQALTGGKRRSVPADDGSFAPEIVSVPEEVAAGRGGSPQIEAEVTGKPLPEISWLKDGQPVSDRDLRTGHVEIIDLPTDKPDSVKQALKINDLRPTDVADYQVKAKNPLGSVESQPTSVKLDRSMSSSDMPVVKGLDQAQAEQAGLLPGQESVPEDGFAPSIVSAPEEVVAGRGGSPLLEAEVAGKPQPEITWLKDGKPISDQDIKSGHVEVVDLPTDKPDTVKQALKINSLKPADVAEYQVKAENPLGSAESQPIGVKLDRSMSSTDEPVVKGLASDPSEAQELVGGKPASAPKIVRAPKEVVAGPGSSPSIEAEVHGEPKPQLTWYKDGQPIRERLFSLGQLEIVELPTDKPGTVLQALKINDFKPSDAAAYHVKAENPHGQAESEPTQVRLDRSMGPRDEPKVEEGVAAAQSAEDPFGGRGKQDEEDFVAPTIVSMPEEIVAGVGSNPQIVAEVTGKPLPQLTWFKDGQLVSDADLRRGHMELVDLPTNKPDTVKQALKINDLKPADVAAYHVRAENQLGDTESNPTNLRIDRSMGAQDEPQVVGDDVAAAADEVPMEVDNEQEEQKPAEWEIPPAVGPRRRSSAAKCAPEIVSAPKEVVTAPGSSPKLEVQVKAQPQAKVEWLKAGEPIPARLLRDQHIELLEEATPVEGVTKYSLQVNDLRPSDVSAYTLRAENPLGQVETAPIELRSDRSMSKSEDPRVVQDDSVAKPAASDPSDAMVAPSIVSAPEEIVSGPGSSPQIEAEVSGVPKPELTWFKDGQPISERDLKTGHVEIVDLPCDKPDSVKQALKINDLKPADVAAYHVKAENPAGEAESEPTNVRIDRKMSAAQEPLVTGLESDAKQAAPEDLRRKKSASADDTCAPSIVSMPEEIVAGPGSSPQIVAEVAGNPQPQLSWLKDGQPISDRDLRTGHVEVVDLPSDKPDTVKQALKINDMRPSDVAAYKVVAENPLGSAESQPTSVKLDRSMSSSDVPVLKGLDQDPSQQAGDLATREALPDDAFAPSIVSAPEEVVAGRGSSPLVEAEVTGKPLPELSWFKDGQPISEQDLKSGHVEIVDVPTSKPDTLKQALKINDLKPADVAAYHVKAENPLGEVESEPTNVRIDRSMGPEDEPQVVGGLAGPDDEVSAGKGIEKPRISQLARNVKCPLGSSPVLEVEVQGGPPDKVEWFKDGELLREKPDMHLEMENLPDGSQKLRINNFKPQDVGVYKLKATNAAGTAESGPITVDAIVDDVVASPKKEEFAPEIVNMTEEVVAGPGSHPQLEVHVKANPVAEITWYKDGKPLTDRQLGLGHLTLSAEQSAYAPDAIKYVLKVDRMKSTDAATYNIVAKNPLGTAESKPILLKLDRQLEADEAPIVKQMVELEPELAGATDSAGLGEFAPQIISHTDEVVAGVGSAPAIEVAIKARPAPQTTWFKDGQPIERADLDSGRYELVREVQPDDTVVESLRINNLKPADVAAYHVRAENPLGDVESEPTNVRIDRSMDAQDEPQVSKSETPFSPEEAAASVARRGPQAPTIRRIPRKIVAPLGSNPVIEVEIAGEPKPEVVWFKDGRQVSNVRGHMALVELPNGVYRLALSNLKAVDQGDYMVRATNEAGEVQSAPIALVVDANMGPKDVPRVVDSSEPLESSEAGEAAPTTGFAPKIVRVSDRVAGELGGKAVVEVEVSAQPEANVNWLLDGQQIPSRLFDEGHLRVSSEKSPSDEDTTIYTLEIGSLKPSDAGTYSLEAENPFGSAKSPSVKVGVRSADDEAKPEVPSKKKMRAPVIKRAPGRVVAREGTSPVLEVEVSGEPVPEIVWFRNGKRIERTDAHFTFDERPEEGVFKLVVNECVKDDEAVYTLTASNEAGSVESGPIELKVEAAPAAAKKKLAGFAPQVVSTTEEVVAGTGSSPLMELVIKASPAAVVTWFKDGQEIDLVKERGKYTVVVEKVDTDTTRHVLKINDLRPVDVGAYHVHAENVHGSIESEPINVRIDRSMGADEAPLTSKIEAPFEPSEKDFGSDVAAPATGDASSPGKRALRAPVIKRMPRRIVAAPGSSPVIEIVISGEPKPEVVWYKNGKRVTEVRNRIAFEELPDGTFRLCFTDLKVTDQAEYSVVATNEAGTVESGPIELIVDKSLAKNMEPFVQEASELPAPTVVANEDGPIEAPKIRGLDDQIEALVGGTVKLEAEVLGNPKPEIKWLKDGDEVELNVVHEVPNSNRHSLTLRNVSDLYDGVYSLEAKNIAGVARKDASVKIIDDLSDTAPQQLGDSNFRTEPQLAAAKRKSLDEPHDKPFIKRGLKFSQVNQGRSIKFEVQIDGKYDELIWMKDGQQINLPFDALDETGDVEMGAAPVSRRDDDDASTIKASDDEDDQMEVSTGPTDASGKPKRRFPPRILMRPRNIVAGPGSRVAFEVRFEGEPKPEVVWFKNGERVNQSSDGKVTIEEVGEDFVRLIIEDVNEEDVATYQVQLDNSYGQEKSLPVTLELDSEMPASDDLANYYSQAEQEAQRAPDGSPLKRGRAPRILSRPRPVHAPSGSRVCFEVQVAGEPEPVVNWYRDGRVISQSADGHVTIEEFSNGCVRLVLDDISNADVGLYHVVAENKLGSERTIPVTLTIDDESATSEEKLDLVESEFKQISSLPDGAERYRRGGRPPRIVLRPKSLEAPLGGQVTLEVLVVGQSKPSIVWHKDGDRLKIDGKRVRVEELSDSYQRLVISELTSDDSGSYTVSAENDFGVSMSQPPAKLVVSESCSETKQSSMAETTTTMTETTTTTTTSEETFYEHYVNSDDVLHGGEKPPGAKRAPRFTLKPRNRKVPLGAKVDFEVRVSGKPKPDIVWYKNGRRIHTTSDGRVRVEEFSDGGSKLIIEDCEETDHGVYSAEASNEWGKERTEDVQLRVTQRTEVSERTEKSQRGTATVTTRTKKTRSHYTFSEERHGYVTLTISDAQLEHDGDYKLVVRNKWGEASTQAPLVVIPKVEPRSTISMDRSRASYDDTGSSADGRDSRARRTPFDDLEDYGHELDKSVGVFGSESRYQSGEDTYLLQLRDTEFPLRLRKYLRFGARQSPSLRSNLMDAHWGAGARVTVRERRKFREVMDEEIDDEKMGRDVRETPMRLQKEVGTCNYAAAQLEHLRVEAAERGRRSATGETADGSVTPTPAVDMMPPFFRVKLKDAVIEESSSGQQEAVFACLAAGEPKPDYAWFRNDVIITPDASKMIIETLPDGGCELRIRDPRIYDAGCYKCVANNVHGNVISRARLRVASRPSRPEPPEYSAVTAREVLLQWRPPRDTSFDTNTAPILGYRLEMSQSAIGQDDNWTTLAADIGHEYYVVDDLTPATSYTFRVSARNKFGWSDSSYSAYVTTSREQEVAGRLAVPHEWRARQYVSEVCDVHVLRTCEDDKYPKLNYGLEQLPISLNGPDGNQNWRQVYSLQAEIARGRFSIISKGLATAAAATDNDEEDANRKRQVVLKFVSSTSAQAAQTKTEFDIMRSLQHEKVVQLQAAYRDDEMFVFVMERLSGLDVLTYLASFTSYTEETVSQIIQQVMDAIEYLHFRGMCLLELQPDNVVMTNGRTTSLKLVDFSSARFVPRSGARVPVNASQIIEYCPPEVIAGHEVSTASDVWCIGVLTYVLLSGFSPFKGQTEEETRENVRLGRYKYDHIYGNCTPEVTRFLINVFKKHSTKRPTIEQLYENKWLLPNEFMIRKRQHATFRTDKIAAFAEEFHKMKQQQQEAASLQQLASQLGEQN